MAKKFKKLKNIIVASFQAKIGFKRLGRRDNKNYSSVSFLPDLQQKIPKKNKKIKKYHYKFISSQNRLEIDEKERNKNYRSISFRSVPTRCVIENSKRVAKKFKKLKKYHSGFIASENRQEKAAKERHKNYRFVPFRSYPMRNRKFQKRSKKIQKNLKIPLWLHFKP